MPLHMYIKYNTITCNSTCVDTNRQTLTHHKCMSALPTSYDWRSLSSKLLVRVSLCEVTAMYTWTRMNT